MSACLSGIGTGYWLRDLGDLVAGADDAVARRVVDVGNILVLKLSSLPNFDLASTAEDTNTHGGQQVVSGVGVVVDTTVEDGGGVLADGGRDQSLASGVVIDEVGHVVDDTSNGNESLALVLGGVNKVVPADDRELLERGTPVEDRTLLVDLLLHLLNASLFDFVGTELLEVVGETECLPDTNGPLGRVVLPPLNGVAVV